MASSDLQNLLAPTWKERARAEDALLARLMAAGEGNEPWGDDVQAELRALAPTPATFLHGLVDFWAHVAARQYATRMNQPDTWPGLSEVLHRRVYPMTPPEPPSRAFGMSGIWVWKFIERLGPLAAQIEGPLIECLEHPEPCVWGSSEIALGGADALSDQAYARFLANADRRGSDGSLYARARALARHTSVGRVPLLLEVGPSSPLEAAIARFATAGALQAEAATSAASRLASRLDEAWSDAARGALLRALASVYGATDGRDDVIAAIRPLADQPGDEIRAAAIAFLARHLPAADDAVLHAAARDQHPWVRVALCSALGERTSIDPALLRTVCIENLGNYDGGDGEPHECTVALLLAHPAIAAGALDEIARWWNAESADPSTGRETIEEAMRLCEAMRPHADARALLPGFERALARLTEDEPARELPSLDEPGAVPVIRDALEQDMLEAGTDPQIASAYADLHGAVLGELAAGLGELQAQIDADQARYDAEMRELYPEWFETASRDDSGDDDGEDETVAYVDELVEALRELVDTLRAG